MKGHVFLGHADWSRHQRILETWSRGALREPSFGHSIFFLGGKNQWLPWRYCLSRCLGVCWVQLASKVAQAAPKAVAERPEAMSPFHDAFGVSNF